MLKRERIYVLRREVGRGRREEKREDERLAVLHVNVYQLLTLNRHVRAHLFGETGQGCVNAPIATDGELQLLVPKQSDGRQNSMLGVMLTKIVFERERGKVRLRPLHVHLDL